MSNTIDFSAGFVQENVVLDCKCDIYNFKGLKKASNHTTLSAKAVERGGGAKRITRSMSQHVFHKEILCWTAANKLKKSYNQLK